MELDFYVFEQVAAFLEKTKRSGITPVPVSVNVSALHAEDPQTTRRYLEILEKYKVDPGMLEMELKETDTIRYENIKDLLRSLQEAGFHTALDNFGVGSSFINLIADVPLNDVKLGRGFMEKCEKDYRGISFLRQMIGMLKSLGFQVLCEGVESARQVEVLKTSGCDHVQGNWFSMPLSAKEFEKCCSFPAKYSAVAEKMKNIVQGEKHDENNWRRISVAGSGRKKITDGVSGGTSCLSVWCYRRGENFSDPAFS